MSTQITFLIGKQGDFSSKLLLQNFHPDESVIVNEIHIFAQNHN